MLLHTKYHLQFYHMNGKNVTFRYLNQFDHKIQYDSTEDFNIGSNLERYTKKIDELI